MPPSAPSSGSIRPAFWPGLLLHLLLPGSGFTLLGRPWLHLAALLLTVLDWLAAWLLILFVGYSGLTSATTGPSPVDTALIILGLLMFLAAYPLLTWGYFRAYRRSLAVPHLLSPWFMWLLILLHLGGFLLLALPLLLG